jgi:glycosyltransferase involved in cell wall biosynthesis
MGFKKSYRKSYLKYLSTKFFKKTAAPEYDLVFVITENARGWILEAICREIERYFNGKTTYAYQLENLPRGKAYFFAHYSLFYLAIKSNPYLWGAKTLMLHTHPTDIGISKEEFNYIYNKATWVVCMNSMFKDLLIKEGLKKEKVTFVIAGADKDFFKSHTRSEGAVGFSTAYYERKNPDRILNIIKKMPHRRFILLGRNWDKYSGYEDLIRLPNLKYINSLPYEKYPEYYSHMDVFVSPAILEGGPVPLIESMMCNVVPVASITGFAPDIIKHGENGFLFPPESNEDEICLLIEKAFQLKTDVRKSIEHLTWEHFSLNIQKLLN